MTEIANNSNWIPNSFQTPNAYVDQLMALLTPEEWKILSFACRRIYGFNKYHHQDHISISQFTDGIKSSFTGNILSLGTGLCKETVKKCLASLAKFRVMLKVADNDRKA